MNAAMEERTTIEWDKDDLNALEILKVDVLALGMLTALRKGFALIDKHYGQRPDAMRPIPREEACVYAMIQRADTIGVFQIESRAQMSMLPRLKPAEFYDLVIEVAIVRPGPIQGDMVHPYLRRRQGIDEVVYPSEELEDVLGKTLGVPLFQEQAMKIAIVAAGFTPEEADRIAPRDGDLPAASAQSAMFEKKMIEGMVAKGYERDFAARCFKQIEGFGRLWISREPRGELRAAGLRLGLAEMPLSRRLLRELAQFAADGLLRAFADRARRARTRGGGAGSRREPVGMGLHAGRRGRTLLPLRGRRWPSRQRGSDEGGRGGARHQMPHLAQPPSSGAIARHLRRASLDALWRHLLPFQREKGLPLHRRHASMAPDIRATHAVRLGLRQVIGLREDDMKILVGRRGAGYDSIRDLWLRTGLGAAVLERLADADAFRSLGLDRRMALWAVRGLDRVGDQDDLPLFSASRPAREHEPDARLPPMPLGAHIVEDYRRLSLSLKGHPVAFMRRRLEARGVLRSEALVGVATGKRVSVAGLVLVRQRPGTASGVIFMTIEDETGVANIIVWPKVFERLRPIVIGARFVAVTGKLQSEQGVIHLIAERVEDLTPMLGLLSERGPQIDGAMPADEVRRPPPANGDRRGTRGRRSSNPPTAAAPPIETDERDLISAMPGGRNFQ